ncbi:MAG: HNH endonuclease [Chloroflexota bacterium]
MTSLETFAHLFASLRSDTIRARYPAETLHRAPHKPLLLLAVLDLFAENGIPDGRVPVDPRVGEIFSRYWHRVMPPDHRPNMALPFFHLKNDGGFWTLVATPGNERALQRASQIRNMSVLTDLVACARLDPALVLCLSVPAERAQLRDVLVDQYFSPDARLRLLEQADVNVEAYRYSEALLSPRMVAEARLEDAYRPAARSQGFRRAVVTAYGYRCAICGIRVLTADGHAAVEAAHIHPWRVSWNDHPTNGLALCRLCHWGFDEGLLGADRQRTILVSPQLSREPNVPGHLAQLAQGPLFAPNDQRLAADPEALVWHRRHVFRAR